MTKLSDILKDAQSLIETAIKNESHLQGHYLTGAMERSLSAEITSKQNATTLEGSAIFYTKFVDQGVPSSRIPFGEGSGAKHSAYIQGLISYFKLRGLAEKEAISAAFATAKKHKKEGMPTKGSYRFSRNGSRLRMLINAFKSKQSQLDAFVTKELDILVEKDFKKEKSETL